MKKIFNFMMIALVAMVAFTSCSDDCNHEFIEYDYNKALVGTWTYLEGEQAEAMVIEEDGSFAVTGIMEGGELYESKGTIKVVNNKVSLVFEGDKDVIEGRLELVAGNSMSIVLNEEYDVRLTYNYCVNDLSDEIVGMWVYNDAKNAMRIHSFDKNGSAVFTGWSDYLGEFSVLSDSKYMVFGDLLFQGFSNNEKYIATKLMYVPNGNSMGDMLYISTYAYDEASDIATTTSWLRVKQELNLNGKTYAYSSAYVTNAKGADEDFSIMDHTFNIAKIKASDFDVMFGADLFLAEFPNSNTMKHRFFIDGQDAGFVAPITVAGNKVTIDMSVVNPALRKVNMYMFQDADDSQLHMYMPTASFINYFANMELYALILSGKLDPADAAAVEKIFTDMEARIESINVSFVMKALN